MPVKRSSAELKTWVEINSSKLLWNVRAWRKIIGPRVKLWAVVKSNAYGHGLLTASRAFSRSGVDGFCVDSVAEGVALREAGLKKHILVLGPTLPALFKKAKANGLVLTVSSMPGLKALLAEKFSPLFHLKVDTGMHRQGIYASELPIALRSIERAKKSQSLSGIYTHFASAKDLYYPAITEKQFSNFEEVMAMAKASGHGGDKIFHAAATGGTLMGSKYHLGAVRIGMGLYGYHPSEELELQLPRLGLSPALGWRAVVSEVKDIEPQEFIGYDFTERVRRRTRVAIVPIGYWHGFPRSLSGVGYVLLSGKRSRALGRVSMDLLAVDATGVPVRVGDKATLIGKDGKEFLSATEVAKEAGTTHYELLARLNPLMERKVI